MKSSFDINYFYIIFNESRVEKIQRLENVIERPYFFNVLLIIKAIKYLTSIFKSFNLKLLR